MLGNFQNNVKVSVQKVYNLCVLQNGVKKYYTGVETYGKNHTIAQNVKTKAKEKVITRNFEYAEKTIKGLKTRFINEADPNFQGAWLINPNGGTCPVK